MANCFRTIIHKIKINTQHFNTNNASKSQILLFSFKMIFFLNFVCMYQNFARKQDSIELSKSQSSLKLYLLKLYLLIELQWSVWEMPFSSENKKNASKNFNVAIVRCETVMFSLQIQSVWLLLFYRWMFSYLTLVLSASAIFFFFSSNQSFN